MTRGQPLSRADKVRIWAAVARGMRRTADIAEYFSIDARTAQDVIKDACVYATERIRQDRAIERLDELSDPS